MKRSATRYRLDEVICGVVPSSIGGFHPPCFVEWGEYRSCPEIRNRTNLRSDYRKDGRDFGGLSETKHLCFVCSIVSRADSSGGSAAQALDSILLGTGIAPVCLSHHHRALKSDLYASVPRPSIPVHPHSQDGRNQHPEQSESLRISTGIAVGESVVVFRRRQREPHRSLETKMLSTSLQRT